MANEQQRPEKAPAVGNGWEVVGGLPEGPLDLIGDIHGEIDAMLALFEHLGYRPNGEHPEGRRMVFLGDLVDRGPDSPGVVRKVEQLVAKGRAVTVMGNHDLNAIARIHKKENTWLFGQGPVSEAEKRVGSDREREDIIGFLRAQPLARQRPDLRVVHACWDDEALRSVQGTRGAEHALHEHKARIDARFAADHDEVEATLAHQNENPIKLITSGPEVRAANKFFAGGKWRMEARHPWWDRYDTGPVVVFGHYWRIPVVSLQKDDGLFARQPLNTLLGKGKAFCVDYSVGGRASERAEGRTKGPFSGRLAALRWPENELVFDDGERQRVAMPQNGMAQ